MIKRNLVFSENPQIALQYLPNFVLRKCPDSFPEPPEMGHYAYFLDYTITKVEGKLGIIDSNYNFSERPRIEDFTRLPIPNELAQGDADNSVLNEMVFLINAISNNYIFQYSSNRGWFITLDGTFQSFYGQEHYKAPEFNAKPEILDKFENYETTERPILYFKNRNGESELAVKLSDLFKLYFSSDKIELKKKYLNACVILTKAYQLRKIDWSASYVFLVSAIESLIEIEYEDVKPEICTCCKMPHFAVRQKFMNFIDKYGYDVSKKTKDLFSSIRNGIVHKGKLFGGGHSHKWIIESQEDLDAMYDDTINRLHYEAFQNLVLTCFRTFLYFNFKRIGT